MKRKFLPIWLALAGLVFIPLACSEDSPVDDEEIPGKPSLSLTVSGLSVSDGKVNVSIKSDSVLEIAYSITAPGLIQTAAWVLDGVESDIDDVGGAETSGKITLDLPFESASYAFKLKVDDMLAQTASADLSIVVTAVEEEETTTPPPALQHGDLQTIVVAGAGSKADNNVGNYTFAGHRHIHHRFTDFENATTAEPASNTKNAWQEMLGGIFPSTVATDFNSKAAADGCTVHLEGGPTPSGRYLQRVSTSNGLPTFNLFALSPTERTSRVFVSSYIRSITDVNAGKVLRMYWRLYNGDGSKREDRNLYPVKQPGTQLTWRCEGSFKVGWSDQRLPSATGWNRIDMMVDFEENKYVLMLNGQTLTDVSVGYDGWVYDQVDDGYLHYALLGNTIIPNKESDAAIQFAQPVADWDLRRIEIADSDDWDSKTRSVIQPVKSWSDDNITFIVNQGDFEDLENKHIFYLDGLDVTYVGPLEP